MHLVVYYVRWSCFFYLFIYFLNWWLKQNKETTRWHLLSEWSIRVSLCRSWCSGKDWEEECSPTSGSHEAQPASMDTLKPQRSKILTFLNLKNRVPAHKASGVCPQNWLDPFHPELCQLPAESALRNREKKMQDGERRWAHGFTRHWSIGSPSVGSPVFFWPAPLSVQPTLNPINYCDF